MNEYQSRLSNLKSLECKTCFGIGVTTSSEVYVSPRGMHRNTSQTNCKACNGRGMVLAGVK